MKIVSDLRNRGGHSILSGNLFGPPAFSGEFDRDSQTGVSVQGPSESFLKRYFPTRHAELPLAHIADFPALAQVLQVWRAGAESAVPRALDPLDLPPSVFPYIMLLDFTAGRSSLVIRLAGDFVREKHGGPVKGKTPYDFFDAADADQVMAHARQVADSRTPSLATREYVGIDEAMWSYTRLMLPLASDGGAVDQIFKVIEPATLSEVGRDPYVA